MFKKYLDEERISKTDLIDGIRFLTEALYKHHGIRSYVLFDEYDQVINSIISKEINAISSELVAKATKLIKDFFSSCSKS
ncbi:MAG: AAA family ATPase [Candidatus Midichloria sp.]|nr:AAA family ATPase [Candidatus Midichloria sp.]